MILKKDQLNEYHYYQTLEELAEDYFAADIYDKSEMKKNGFDYFCIGINTMKDILKPELNTVN